jgi:hypothetical protein
MKRDNPALMFLYQKNKRQYIYLPYYAFNPQAPYNGGHENLIRLAENWNEWSCDCTGESCTNCSETGSRNTLSILGTTHFLWISETLERADGSTAYWVDTGYTAPERDVRYAKSLQNDACKPPGIPSSVSFDVEGRRIT